MLTCELPADAYGTGLLLVGGPQRLSFLPQEREREGEEDVVSTFSIGGRVMSRDSFVKFFAVFLKFSF